MTIFDHYAEYYDLLYSTKDYQREVGYVSGLIKRYRPGSKSILDVGCGTGSHGFRFLDRGYDVTGVDLSQRMIERAKAKQLQLDAQGISFSCADVRSLDLGREFDVVVSLFHVLNYLTSNDDMAAGFGNAVRHTRAGGLFIFDCWYGPTVLADPPKIVVRRFENDRVKVLRVAEPVMHPNHGVVDVNYEIVVQEKQTRLATFIRECHAVRYFFRPELEGLLHAQGVEILAVEEWLSGGPPGANTFAVCFVCRKY